MSEAYKRRAVMQDGEDPPVLQDRKKQPMEEGEAHPRHIGGELVYMPEGESPVRTATPIRIGSISTTIGVLLMNALSTAVIRMVTSRERTGPLRQSLASKRPTGSSAPVWISPWPTMKPV